MSDIVKHCWPTPWLEAARAAGFARYDGLTKSWVFLGGDTGRQHLEQFALAIAKNERESARSRSDHATQDR